VRSSHSFDLPESSHGAEYLAIGEDVPVVRTIPMTRGIRLHHVLRLTVFVDGRVRYTVR